MPTPAKRSRIDRQSDGGEASVIRQLPPRTTPEPPLDRRQMHQGGAEFGRNFEIKESRRPAILKVSSPDISNVDRAAVGEQFLRECNLCRKKLFDNGSDVYMYGHFGGFCSEECRYKRIYKEEGEKEAAPFKPAIKSNVNGR